MKVCSSLGAALAIAAASLACSETSASPASPSGTSPFAANFNGLYSGALVLTDVRGGECVGADLGRRVGSVDVSTVTITQNQSDVTAVVRSATTGLQCTYVGSASPSILAVNARSCDVSEILFGCTSGEARVLELVGSTITATIIGNSTRGTVATSYNVFSQDPETRSRIPIAGLVTQQQFDATRR